VVNFTYSDTLNTQGVIKFYWVVSDRDKKQYKWFGSLPIETPQIRATYNSAIQSFTPYTVDSIIVIPSDYLNKYTLLIK